MHLALILHTPDLFVYLILYPISCQFIPDRFELYLTFRPNVQCADSMKQSIFPLSFVLVRISIDLDSNSIGRVVFEIALVNSIIGCLLSEAISFIFNKLALEISATLPCVGPLTIQLVIDEFAFV